MTTKKSKPKIPIILIHPSSVSSLAIFNPNLWKNASKQIVRSCAAQHSLLQYSLDKLNGLFNNADKLCQPSLQNLESQWNTAKWTHKKCRYFVEIPEVHLYIQIFLVSVKTFLDLIIQLISSEKIINNKIHGFHKKNKIIGGGILNLLDNNSGKSKKDTANKIATLIKKHKKDWLDEIISIRDLLTHPEKGIAQVMFEMEFRETRRGLKLIKIIKPKINASGADFNDYAKGVLKKVEIFSKDFLELIKHSNPQARKTKRPSIS